MPLLSLFLSKEPRLKTRDIGPAQASLVRDLPRLGIGSIKR
jgi:hypothetical protein